MKKTLLPVFACLALLFCASPAFALTDEEFLDLVLNDEVEEVRAALAAGQNPDIVRIPGPIQLEIRRLEPSKQKPLYRGTVYADGPLFRVSGDAVPSQTVSEEPKIQAPPVPEREPKPAPTPGRDPRRKDIRRQSPLMATPLSIAVANGSMEMIRVLLEGGADVNLHDKAANTALNCIALTPQAKQAAPRIVRTLIDAGADVNARNAMGETPLYHALSLDTEIVAMLLSAGARVNGVDRQGRTLLQRALSMENAKEKAALLLKAGADVNATDEDYQSPLFYVAPDDAETALLLIEAGADLNARNRFGDTLLAHFAPSEEIVRLLVRSGAGPEEANYQGQTPLYRLLVESGLSPRQSLRGAKNLIAAGADVNATDDEGTTLLIAALKAASSRRSGPPPDKTRRETLLSLVRLLLEKGADPGIPDKMEFFPIHYAVVRLEMPDGRFADWEKADFVRTLLDAGASPDPGGRQGSPLMSLGRVAGGRNKNPVREAEYLELLLSAGANVNAVDSQGRSVLFHWLNADPYGVRRLIRAGADVNFVWNGIPPIAYTTGRAPQNLNVLIEAGADVEATVSGDLFPLTVAVVNNDPAIVRTLLEAGANADRRAQGLHLLHACAGIYRLPFRDGIVMQLFSSRASRRESDIDRIEIARALIEAGANVNATVDEDAPLGNLNLRGATPLDLARLMREDALAEALERAGGKATDLIENLKRQLKQAPTPP